MNWLSGRKTYLVALAAGILTIVQSLGFIDAATYSTLMGLLGAGGLATLRAGVAKVR